MTEKTLNNEQLDAVTHSEGPLLIIAGAGTGKTTVITERVKHLITSGLAKPEEILALTFTEKAALEMETRIDQALPLGYSNMWVMTFHGFCDAILRESAIHIGLDSSYKLLTTAESIDLLKRNLFSLNLSYFLPLGNPTKFLFGLLNHFSRLQDENISPSQYLAWAQKQHSDSPESKLEVQKWQELARAYQIYDEIKIKNSFMDFGDLLSKTIQLFENRPNVLQEYQKRFKFILVDEFQDTNYAQNELTLVLSGKKGNIAVVGDDDQCLPAIALISTPEGPKPIASVKVKDKVLTAVGRGHLGISQVTKVFEKKKKARFLTFSTESGHQLTVTDNHQMFCMNPGKKFLNEGITYVYLMHRDNLGWRLGITDDLAQRLKLERSADKILAIKSCASLEEARFYEAIYSMRYQIPTYPFEPRKRMILTDDWLTRLFGEFDTNESIKRLSRDLRIDPQFHHYCLDAVARGSKKRIKILLNMCVRRYRIKNAHSRLVLSPQIIHTVNLETSSQEVLALLQNHSVSLRKGRKGWRVRKAFSDLSEASEFAQLVVSITSGILEVRFNCGLRGKISRSSLMMPAKNILVGMSIPILRNQEVVYEKVIAREEFSKETVVFDLEIAKTHNFIADGVIVHNSIYRFRGAAVSNILSFKKNFPEAKVVTLTQNYRSKQIILDHAYTLVAQNNPDRLEVLEKINKKLVAVREGEGVVEFSLHAQAHEEAEQVAKKILELTKAGARDFRDFAVLVRANNHAESFIRSFTHEGIPFQFLGPGKLFLEEEITDLVSYLRVVADINDSQSLYRVLSMPIFELPALTLAHLSSRARRESVSLFEVCTDLPEDTQPETLQKVTQVVELVTPHVASAQTRSAGEILYEFVQKSGILDATRTDQTPEGVRRAENIAKFFQKIKTFEIVNPGASVVSVVDWITLQSDLGESPQAAEIDWSETNAVNILTVHSAKGLEFPVVFLVNLVGQRFPSMRRAEQIPIPEDFIKETLPTADYHLQEERRLFYVGMTRAQDELYLTAAKFYGDGRREKKISPFVPEAMGDAAQLSLEPNLQTHNEPKAATSSVQRKTKFSIATLSYSQIETFSICPLHYKLRYIDHIPTAPSAAQSFGISFHATLKEFHEQLNEGKKPTMTLLDQLLVKNWVKVGYLNRAHREASFEKARAFLQYYLKNYFKPDVKTIGLEHEFKVSLNGLTLTGKVDRIDEVGSGIHIIDYKTGNTVMSQKEADKSLQLSIYALAATKIRKYPFSKKPEEVALSLYYFDEPQIVTTQRTQKQLDEAVEEILEWKNKIETSDFACSGSFLCLNCEYKTYCRAQGE